MWAAPEQEGGFLTADLEEMNWHTLAVDPRTPQQTLTVNQRKDKGRHFSFFAYGSKRSSFSGLDVRAVWFPPVVANIISAGEVIELRGGRATPEE